MNKRTKKLLRRYNLKDADLLNARDQMLAAFLLLMDAADGIFNTNDALIYNACGEIGAPDGTHYQIQVMLVPNKKHWIPSEGVFFSLPIGNVGNVDFPTDKEIN